ncbi:MAG: transcription termination/antitermination protein NusG [Pirellulales bacterium]
MPILDKEPSLFPEDLLELDPALATERRWWAVYTKARQEKSLARDLFGFKIPFYLPLVAKKVLVRNRHVHSHVPIFSGYVFLYGSEEERVRSLRTNRISRILPVPDQFQLHHDLKQVRQLIESNAPLTVESRLAPGRRVRIRAGAMTGLEGTVIARRREVRLLVAVTFLQRGVSVEIDDFLCEPLD